MPIFCSWDLLGKDRWWCRDKAFSPKIITSKLNNDNLLNVSEWSFFNIYVYLCLCYKAILIKWNHTFTSAVWYLHVFNTLFLNVHFTQVCLFMSNGINILKTVVNSCLPNHLDISETYFKKINNDEYPLHMVADTWLTVSSHFGSLYFHQLGKLFSKTP